MGSLRLILSTVLAGIWRCRTAIRNDPYLSFEGNKDRISTPNAFPRIASSESVTQRNCASILERVPRLMSHPWRPHLAASISCVKPSSYLVFRICGPTMFCLFGMLRFWSLTL